MPTSVSSLRVCEEALQTSPAVYAKILNSIQYPINTLGNIGHEKPFISPCIPALHFW